MNKNEMAEKLSSIFENSIQQMAELIEDYAESKKNDPIAKGEVVNPDYGLWKPKEMEYYYYVGDNGKIYNNMYALGWVNSENRILIGNCFKTQEEAEKHLEHLKVETQLREIAARLNKGREIDWETGIKYCLLLDTAHNFINQYHGENAKYQGTIYCLNPDFKDVAIAEIGEERLRNYLKEC